MTNFINALTLLATAALVWAVAHAALAQIAAAGLS
jgi:hypothetical protein